MAINNACKQGNYATFRKQFAAVWQGAERAGEIEHIAAINIGAHGTRT